MLGYVLPTTASTVAAARRRVGCVCVFVCVLVQYMQQSVSMKEGLLRFIQTSLANSLVGLDAKFRLKCSSNFTILFIRRSSP